MKKLSRRDFLLDSLSVAAAVPLASASGAPRMRPARLAGTPAPPSFTLESYAAASLNYFDRLVDADGLPYFNVFWTSPAEAAHDWPDFGDVMTRQWQGAVMLRRMTGREAAVEKVWRRKILSLIDSRDGLLHRPETSYCKPGPDWGDASLTLYALVTAAEDGDDEARKAAVRMAESMAAGLRSGDFSGNGFAIKGLMTAARRLGCEAALEAAGRLVDREITNGRTFTPDNTFGPSGHMHGNLRTMAGAADYALTVGDPVLFGRIDALYRWVRTTGTSFGFIPEVIGRHGDIIACETCALMDFAGVGVTLANHGHPEYWADMERLARNHYVESQVRDASWLVSDNSRPDTAQFTTRDIGPRIVGAWAGWTSPNHILAARETLNAQWGGPELKNKTRALQNCCGGSGVHGLYILWRGAARFEDGVLSVHLHLDKKLPQAEIRSGQPYNGLLRIDLARDLALRVRIPEFTSAAQMRVRVNGAELPVAGGPVDAATAVVQRGRELSPARPFGKYLEIGKLLAGDRIEVAYPLPVRTEEVAVRQPGIPDVALPGDLEGRYGDRAGAGRKRRRDRLFRFRQSGQRGLLRGRRSRTALSAKADGGNGRSRAGADPEDSGGLDFWKIR